ncbi:MAG: acetylglutamate kinase [Dehalococcoidia bacterium]
MPESEELLVIKIGGSTLGAEDTTLDDVVGLQREGVPLVVVHGGGPAVTQWMDRQGLTARFVRGLRVTDAASLEIVVAVLAGLVNKHLVAEVNARGGQAAGICGADGPTILAEVTDPEYGRVGQVREVRTRLLKTLLAAGSVPFLSPVGLEMAAPSLGPSAAERGRGDFSRNGGSDSPLPHGAGEGAGPASPLLNINADTVAGEVAAALGASRLVFLTDVPGVKGAAGDFVSELTADECTALIESGAIGGGMIPKVEACLRAAEAGAEALIIDGRQPHALRSALSGSVVGTRVG